MTKNSCSKKIHQKILAISHESQQVEQAFKEWRFNGAFKDHGAPIARCELCGHTRLRYHFRIINRHTGEALWVGSQCILNFDLSPTPSGKEHHPDQKTKHSQLLSQIEEAKIAKLLIPLQQLYEQVNKSDQRRIHWAVGKFQRRSAFSPKDLAWVFQAMQMLGIEFQAQSYPLTLRSKQDRVEYSQLSLTARAVIAPSLTPIQQQKLNC